MDSQTLWLIALSIATPIAGVVGFAIQLRQVKKTRLENEKLQLEIEALKKQAAAKENRIIPVTTEDVLRFGSSDVRFSRRTYEENIVLYKNNIERKFGGNLLIILGAIIFVSYLVFDLYRLVIAILNF